MKIKNVLAVVIAAIVALQVAPASAQGTTPPPTQLTQAQMKKAIVVKDGSAVSRSSAKGEIYRFANCDETDPDAPVIFW